MDCFLGWTEAESTQIDTKVKSQMMFLVLFRTQDDRYEPETARALMDGLRGLGEEEGRVSVTLYAEDAACGLWEERN